MSSARQRTTLAGALVTGTACAATLALVLTTCVLYLRGDLEAAKDAALQAGGALAATLALLSRTREDPATPAAGTASDPVSVVADAPLPTTEVPPGVAGDGEPYVEGDPLPPVEAVVEHVRRSRRSGTTRL